jgi:hypothetical protein
MISEEELSRTNAPVLTWTAWNNGSYHRSGAGYGFKIPIKDRDTYFKKLWDSVSLILPFLDGAESTNLNINKSSFWSPSCRELISQNIGRWLIGCGLAPWSLGSPPRVQVAVIGPGQFEIRSPKAKRI